MDRSFILSKEQIAVPVKTGREERCLEIFDGSRKIFEFMVPAGEECSGGRAGYAFDYIAGIRAEEYVGRRLTVRGDFPEGFFDLILDQPEEYYPPEKRPRVHFTANYGWINDPNGLIFDGSYYHMYFQHNPCNIIWNNMSWGHARSRDLVHWEQLRDVMYPDENGTVFSGCGLFLEGKYYFPYTVAGTSAPWNMCRPFYQGLAVSGDGGATLQKQKDPLLWVTGRDSRDPKVFWHEESGAYIMILYLEKNDFGIFRSEDLKNWEISQRFTVPRAWECPDLLRVRAKDSEESRWMFWCADGFYYWGAFDGYRFTSDFAEHHAFAGGHLYATQSFWGTADRIITVSWIRLSKRNGGSFHGAMTIPREYSFIRRNGDCILLQEPVREFRDLCMPVSEVPKEGVYVAEIPMEHFSARLYMEVNGSTVEIDPGAGTLRVDEETADIPGDFDRVELVVDYNLLEISFSCAIIVAYKIVGSANSFRAEWRTNGNIKGCGSQNRTDCNYSLKSPE